MSTCLITGGLGFIGSNTARKLLQLGYNVKIIDNLSTGSIANIADIRNRVELVKGDVTSQNDVKKAVKGADFIFHFAAMTSVPKSMKSPVETSTNNTYSTLVLLNEAIRQGIKKFIFASSAAVYGNSMQLPKKESFVPEPMSPYALSKITSEYYLKSFNSIYGLDSASLRYFNVYGPYQSPSSQYSGVISLFMKSAIEKARPKIYGTGTQTRDFVFVDDVVNANILSMKKKTNAESINIATSTQTSILSLLGHISAISKEKLNPEFMPPRPGDIVHSVADISKAKELLGFKPEHTLSEGLKKTFEWFMKTYKKA